MVELAGGDGGDDCGGSADRGTRSERNVERDVEDAAGQRRADRGEKKPGVLSSGSGRASVSHCRVLSSLVGDDGRYAPKLGALPGPMATVTRG